MRRAVLAFLLFMAFRGPAAAGASGPSRRSFRWPSGTAAARRGRPCSSPTRAPRKRPGAATCSRSRRSASTPIRCWIDWASGEPAPGQYRLDTLDVLLSPRRGGGAQGHRPGLHGLGARVGGAAAPGLALRQLERAGDPARVVARATASTTRACAQADLAFYEAVARRARGEPGLPRLRPLERAARHQLGEPHLHPEPRVLLLPEHGRALPRLAAEEVRHARRAERGLVPPLRVLGRGRAEPPQHHPLLHRLHRLEDASSPTSSARTCARATRPRSAARPDRVATSHAAGVGLFSSPHYWEGQSDDWTMAAQVDYYGTSFYPKHSAFVDRDVEWRGALLDFARSFGYANGRRGFWIGELQAGFGTIALNVSPDGHAGRPADLDLERARARGEGDLHLRLLPDEHRLRVGRLRPDPARRDAHRARARRPGASPRSSIANSALFLAARPAAARGGGRLQPARALRGRPAAGRGLRRAAGRGGGHRARLAARRLPGAVPDERAARLRPRRPPDGERARAATSWSCCPTR